jgi:hypothetical protein
LPIGEETEVANAHEAARQQVQEEAAQDPKKRLELVALKAAIGQIRQDYAFSERRACGVMTMAVSSYRYQARRSDEPLRTRLVELAREKPRFGYTIPISLMKIEPAPAQCACARR